MTETVIRVEGLSKLYRLGVISSGTIKEDFLLWLAKLRGKEDEYYTIGEAKKNELVWALRDVSFELKKGEILGIVGKNGAGKSTLLKLLSRVTEPTKGNIKVKGRIASLLEVGTGFHPELTGRENVYLNGAILGMTKTEIRAKFDEIVAFSGVEKYIDTPVKRYSSGMYVRLAFAVAAHLEPEILIVDEVLAVGDVDFQAKCLGKMKDVSGAGRTVLFVSHSMAAVRSLCTKALLIEKGVLISSGEAPVVIDKYLGLNKVSTEGSIQFESSQRPGNGAFFINRIRLLNSNSDEATSFFISSDLRVEIEFEITRVDTNVCLSLAINSAQGEPIFATLNTTDRQYEVKKEKGLYKTTLFIPKNLLNNGRYYITLNGYERLWQNHFAINNILSFEMLDDDFLRKDYKQGFGGYIRPELNWETIKLN